MASDGVGGRADTAAGDLGIVVTNGRGPSPPRDAGPAPRIAVFIWGGKVRPSPTLPYGRWKGAA